jgi:hypothetical protein
VTILSEFDLIAIERRADELECETDGQWYLAHQVAADVVTLLGLVREMREGGRVPLPDSTPSAH